MPGKGPAFLFPLTLFSTSPPEGMMLLPFDEKPGTMGKRNMISEHVVEDGFSLESEGLSPRSYRQFFSGLPRKVLERLLNHFVSRNELEVCKVILDLMKTPQARAA